MVPGIFAAAVSLFFAFGVHSINTFVPVEFGRAYPVINICLKSVEKTSVSVLGPLLVTGIFKFGVEVSGKSKGEIKLMFLSVFFVLFCLVGQYPYVLLAGYNSNDE